LATNEYRALLLATRFAKCAATRVDKAVRQPTRFKSGVTNTGDGKNFHSSEPILGKGVQGKFLTRDTLFGCGADAKQCQQKAVTGIVLAIHMVLDSVSARTSL
jgi:hypothetical protein